MTSIHTARFNATQRALGLELVSVWVPAEARSKFEFQADDERIKFFTALVDEGVQDAIALMAARRRVVVKARNYETFMDNEPRFLQGGSGFKQGNQLYQGYHELCDKFEELNTESDRLERRDWHGTAWKVAAARAWIVSQQIKRYEQRVKEYIAAERTHAKP